MSSTFGEILSSPILKNTVSNIFGKKPSIVVIERPGCFILSLSNEPEEEVTRIIVLKPYGFTANSTGELSSHPETRDATIEIKGIARRVNNGYAPAKNCLEFVYYPGKIAETLEFFPYAKADRALKSVKNSRTKFKVVKPGGFGFYHNLINLTGEWLVLVLRKKLDLTKQIDYSLLDDLTHLQKRFLLDFLEAVKENGDSVFEKNKDVVKKVLSMTPETSLPALISFLNIPEGGRHEQCTVFAVILKIARINTARAKAVVQRASKDKTAQNYYLNQLLEKIP